MSSDITLSIRGVSKVFGATTALTDVDLEVQKGEFVTLLGPSGSGKTTLLRLIVGFETPTTGQIMLDGRDISRLSPAERSAGMVFQQYALFPHLTVADNIAYGLKMRKWSRSDRRARVEEMLELVHLTGYGERVPRQLSGGQQQRVALARALAYHPSIILMDEPLGALDRSLRIEMEQVIRRVHRDTGATVVYVTHDRQEALALSDRIAIMRDARLLSVGTPDDLYYRPVNSFVASFFADANLVPATLVEGSGDGTASVRYPGGETSCRTSGDVGGAIKLAIRPRSLGLDAIEGGIRLRGTVSETLLFGDERELVCDVPDAGRIVALVGSRRSESVAVGDVIELHASPEEAIVVGDESGDTTSPPAVTAAA